MLLKLRDWGVEKRGGERERVSMFTNSVANCAFKYSDEREERKMTREERKKLL